MVLILILLLICYVIAKFSQCERWMNRCFGESRIIPKMR